MHRRFQALNKAVWTEDMDLMFPNSLDKSQDEQEDHNKFKRLLKAVGVPNYELYQLQKNAITAMASQADLKTLMEYTGHKRISTVLGSFVFATSESMLRVVSGMDKLRKSEHFKVIVAVDEHCKAQIALTLSLHPNFHWVFHKV